MTACLPGHSGSGQAPGRLSSHGRRVCYPWVDEVFIWTRRVLAVEPHGSVKALFVVGMLPKPLFWMVNFD
jgi:hypothetical protein